jgi:hypothetical protein
METACSVPGCTRIAKARGWCVPHWKRWRRNGNPTANASRVRRSVDERFWEKVDRSGGADACWPWTASRDALGYGFFRVSTRQSMWKSHRVAWLLTRGERPSLLVCHRCDNPPCCNPAHLFLGTNADNIADRDAKGRTAVGMVTHFGEASPLAKLSDEQVRQIRELYAGGGISQAAIAARYGVAQTHVGRIVRGKRRTATHLRPPTRHDGL